MVRNQLRNETRKVKVTLIQNQSLSLLFWKLPAKIILTHAVITLVADLIVESMVKH
jgi:hypothetical protein